MTIQLGVLMDPIQSIQYKKDSTLAMLFEAARRGWRIHYFEQSDIFMRDGIAYGKSRLLTVYQDASKWFQLGDPQTIPLAELDVILMRKDPPFDLEYIYSSYILEQAEHSGVLVVNKPQSLRDANEKLYLTWFPECCPKTLVTRDLGLLREFFREQQDIVCKPLDGMGGVSVFRLSYPDINASVVFETLSARGTRMMMAQRYIPEIVDGDKRILLINGEPIPFALARIPAKGELRGNLAAGATGVARPLTPRDRYIAEQVGPRLREKGLLFVGLDVIGDYLTEINVTSPTCIRELDEQCGLTIATTFFDVLAAKLKKA